MATRNSTKNSFQTLPCFHHKLMGYDFCVRRAALLARALLWLCSHMLAPLHCLHLLLSIASDLLAVVRALCAPLLHSAFSCTRPAHSIPTLRLPCRAGSLGQRTLSLLFILPFPLALEPFMLVLVSFCLLSLSFSPDLLKLKLKQQARRGRVL